MIQIEDFSDGYYFVDAELTPYNGTSLSVTNKAYMAMREKTDLPLIKLDSRHYLATPESAIPRDTIAVPHSVEIEDEIPLMPKQDRAKEVAKRGEWMERASAEPET